MIFSYKRTITTSGEEINTTATAAPTTQVEPPSKVVCQSFTTLAIGNNLHNECVGTTSKEGSLVQRLGWRN